MNLEQRKEQLIKENQEAISEYENEQCDGRQRNGQCTDGS